MSPLGGWVGYFFLVWGMVGNGHLMASDQLSVLRLKLHPTVLFLVAPIPEAGGVPLGPPAASCAPAAGLRFHHPALSSPLSLLNWGFPSILPSCLSSFRKKKTEVSFPCHLKTRRPPGN